MIRNIAIIFFCFVVLIALLFFHRTERSDMVGQEDSLYKNPEIQELLEEVVDPVLEEKIVTEVEKAEEKKTEESKESGESIKENISIKFEKPPFIK